MSVVHTLAHKLRQCIVGSETLCCSNAMGAEVRHGRTNAAMPGKGASGVHRKHTLRLQWSGLFEHLLRKVRILRRGPTHGTTLHQCRRCRHQAWLHEYA